MVASSTPQVSESMRRFAVTCPRLGWFRMTFPYFVAAYHALADEFAVPIEDVWRRLWHYGAGTVRENFVPTLRNLRPLTGRRQFALGVAADRLFDGRRAGW
jgi:hypothetical protein